MPFFGARRNGNDQGGPTPGQVRRAAELEANGIVYLNEGNLAKAESTFRRALALNAQSATIHGNLAVALYRLGRYDDAGVESRDAVYLAPTDDALQRTHGMIFEAMGRLDEAAIAYCKAVELKPDSPHAHAALGSLSLKRGDIQGAENLVATALRLDPNDPQAIEDMAEIKRRQGDLDAAVATLEAALLRRPALPALNFKLGQLLAEKGQPAQACAVLQKALTQRPHDADILFSLGAVMLQTGRHEEVRRLYDQAMKGAPSRKQRYETDLRRLLVEHMAAQPAEEDLPVPVPSRNTPSGRLMLDAMPALISPAYSEPARDAKPDRVQAVPTESRPAAGDTPVLTLVSGPGHADPESPGTPLAPTEMGEPAPPRATVTAREPTASHVKTAPTADALSPAIMALEARIKKEPSNSRLYHDLSILYLRAGRLSEAMEMARQAEKLRSGARQLERAAWS